MIGIGYVSDFQRMRHIPLLAINYKNRHRELLRIYLTQVIIILSKKDF